VAPRGWYKLSSSSSSPSSCSSSSCWHSCGKHLAKYDKGSPGFLDREWTMKSQGTESTREIMERESAGKQQYKVACELLGSHPNFPCMDLTIGFEN